MGANRGSFVLIVEFSQHHFADLAVDLGPAPVRPKPGAARRRCAGSHSSPSSRWSRCPGIAPDRHLFTRMQARHVHLANRRRRHRRPIELTNTWLAGDHPASAQRASMSSYGRGGTRSCRVCNSLRKASGSMLAITLMSWPTLMKRPCQFLDGGQDPARVSVDGPLAPVRSRPLRCGSVGANVVVHRTAPPAGYAIGRSRRRRDGGTRALRRAPEPTPPAWPAHLCLGSRHRVEPACFRSSRLAAYLASAFGAPVNAWGAGELPLRGLRDGQPTLPAPRFARPRCSPRTIAGVWKPSQGSHINAPAC